MSQQQYLRPATAMAELLPPYNGRNTFRFQDGSSYDGEWQNFLPDGYGTYTWPNGSKYVGCFKAGLFHGDGKLFDKQGTTYVGKFERGLLQGSGTVVHYSGNKFQGVFVNSEAHGSGKYSFQNSQVDGVWEKGHFLASAASHEGTAQSEKVIEAGANRRRHSSEWKGKGLAGVTYSNIAGINTADIATLDVKSGKLAQRRAKSKNEVTFSMEGESIDDNNEYVDSAEEGEVMQTEGSMAITLADEGVDVPLLAPTKSSIYLKRKESAMP
uniref:MORN repeat-containing protein 5 n=1 Tax=Hanusia phi TaxID=3032 RepID=A0A7S0E824_9CRYP